MQIGPRIRVGGTLGKIGQAAKVGLGKLDKAAAPFVAMIPGVGQIAAPIMNMAGTVLDTSHGGVSLGDLGRAGIQSAGMYGAGKLLGGTISHIPGVSTLGAKISEIPGVSALGGALKNIPGVDEIGGFLKGHAGDILTAAQGVQAYGQQQKANSLQNKGLGYATGAYDEKDALRKQALGELTNEQLPDLSSIYGPRGTPNPYARGVTPVGSVR